LTINGKSDTILVLKLIKQRIPNDIIQKFY